MFNLTLCSTIRETETSLWDLFHFLGAVPRFWDAVPQIVKLIQKKWNCSTKSETVPLCVDLLGYCQNFTYHENPSLERNL